MEIILVNFAGQPYLYPVNEKIREFAGKKEQYGYRIILDGAVTPERVRETPDLGEDGVVVSYSGLFKRKEEYKATIDLLKRL